MLIYIVNFKNALVAYLFLNCSENTKNVLIAASFIHLKHKEHAKYTTELTTVNPRILLSGPAGVYIMLFVIINITCNVLAFCFKIYSVGF